MGWSGTANWHCPAMCGCVLAIDADWPGAPEGGVSYRHPIPGTIRSIAIVAVCAAHDSLRTDPLPTDPWYGCRGYMTVPASPTEAERLYIALYRYGGQKVRLDTCGCAIYEVTDRAGGAPTRRGHVRHRVRCAAHDDDNDDGRDALADNDRKNQIVARVAAALGLPPENVVVTWAGARRTRVATVTLVGASPAQRAQLQTFADSRWPGRVIVEVG